SLITDFNAYDSFETSRHTGRRSENWADDLLLECEATADRAEGELVLELGRGVDRFQAAFDLAGGVCTLKRNGRHLDSRAVALAPGAAHALRFADADGRLTLWVDGELPFGDGAAYPEALGRGPRLEDLEPARIEASGPVAVRRLRLWRDAYQT